MKHQNFANILREGLAIRTENQVDLLRTLNGHGSSRGGREIPLTDEQKGALRRFDDLQARRIQNGFGVLSVQEAAAELESQRKHQMMSLWWRVVGDRATRIEGGNPGEGGSPEQMVPVSDPPARSVVSLIRRVIGYNPDRG